ncbi:hypothetical protein LX16_4095 [Stackebrandtia albiflava]|uniref:Uncharacterized protein n=1 Tax=Stackebrandtia albiflava TaxID=406432 RepID=A0A562UYJ1_9ACTN|nr:hypothetical protein [Stackebrandtia albiflava]TWJ10675.1 hypothetical protein LX16_4095 [Stackebrandtia albiflava]
MSWTWHFTDASGAPVDAEHPEHTNQGDAESWLGEVWRDLAAAGAVMATLKEDDRTEYEMPLTSPE